MVFKAVASVSGSGFLLLNDTTRNENEPTALDLTNNFKDHYMSSMAISKNWATFKPTLVSRWISWLPVVVFSIPGHISGL